LAPEAVAASPATVNVASLLDRRAAERPAALAVRRARADASGRFDDTTFDALARATRRIASGLLESGLAPGERVCLFLRPGADFVACVFATLRAGLVPVLIDPGMGRRALLACIERSQPAALVAVARAHAAALLWPRAFASARLRVQAGPGPRLVRTSLADVAARGRDDFAGCATAAEDVAAVLFTSGSTGPPKGVVHTHGIFAAQVRALETLYAFEPGEVDAACFPLFALFDTALGVTSVFPAIDPSRPGRCDPAHVHATIAAARATTAFASPAVWQRVVPWCERHGRRLDGLRRVLTAGAPIPTALVERLVRLMPPGARVFTPYGATECLPVANVSDAEILAPSARALGASGQGNLVGRPAPGMDVRIVRTSDDVLERFDPASELPRGEVGEVLVRGAVATPEYLFAPQATRAAKVPDPAGTFHRMGDLGRIDQEGRLWFCGRRAHRLRLADGDLANVPLENAFLDHPSVARCAAVGVGPAGAQRVVLVVEPREDAAPARRPWRRACPVRQPELERELLAHARARSALAQRVELVLWRRDFPVDPRHNAKIDNAALAAWAAAELAR
jgi:acyl-CoA synthetase (AMP-forming)/AMP-acid ligase II